MTPENFERTLLLFWQLRPFKPFRVHFVSGEHVDVDHPEAMIVRGGTGVYVSPRGAPTLFDHESVSEVTGDVEQKSA